MLSLVAANAALFPRTLVRMYGVELTATGLLVLYSAIDVLGHRAQDGRVDASAHIGGAICGWLMASRWAQSVRFWL